ncbi:hypothetical protein ACJIZ3_020740 [Penstemon smallii]|uniref:Uncharacterized protein n=1 Tax=Penstemon smallii TaxID=265156 RepID=A0ABD3SJW7_9LAMI
MCDLTKLLSDASRIGEESKVISSREAYVV